MRRRDVASHRPPRVQRLRNTSRRAGKSSWGKRACNASNFSSAAWLSPAARRLTISCKPSSNEGSATGARLLSLAGVALAWGFWLAPAQWLVGLSLAGVCLASLIWLLFLGVKTRRLVGF